MSYKSENWKEKLEQVRGHMSLKEGSVEKTADEILNEEIESELNTGFEDDTLPEIEDIEINLEEDVILEASAAGMIDKLFNLKGDKDAGYGVAKMLNMTGVKVIQAMQKQNPQGFMKTVKALGKDKNIKLATNNALMKMFKDQGVKPLPEETETPEKTIEKLTERNMLGRLAKQLHLTKEGKRKMFKYFEGKTND